MLVAIEKLINYDKRYHKRTVGNHWRLLYKDSEIEVINFGYHQTIICQVTTTDEEKTFQVSNGGWNTRSTNRAIKDYRQLFLSKGYTEIP